MKRFIKNILYKPSIARKIVQVLAAIHQASYAQLGAFASAAEGGLHPKHRLMKYHDFFISQVNTGDTVLDVGCGNGALLKNVVLKTKALAVGVEISSENAEAAKRRLLGVNNVEIINADIWDYKDSREYDVIMLSNVLEHLEKRAELLRYLKNQFKPKKILIRVPMFERGWLVPYKKELGIEWRLDMTHKIEYKEDELIAELTSAGLEISRLVIKWGEAWAVATQLSKDTTYG